uniref:Uncharacterized protein n=1 Tax=Molossus molossus TaxID=27622 RepID=A0A7J8I9N0_MOLMO|nr:hypothetical protein HJG59_010558 [Molossus molossus]
MQRPLDCSQNPHSDAIYISDSCILIRGSEQLKIAFLGPCKLINHVMFTFWLLGRLLGFAKKQKQKQKSKNKPACGYLIGESCSVDCYQLKAINYRSNRPEQATPTHLLVADEHSLAPRSHLGRDQLLFHPACGQG